MGHLGEKREHMSTVEMLGEAMRGYARSIVTQLNSGGGADHVSLCVIKHDDDELDFIDVVCWKDGEKVYQNTEFLGGDEA